MHGENFMSAKPLAETYERLKELRRQGGGNSEIKSRIELLAQAILIGVSRGDDPDGVATVSRQSDSLVRTLEVKTLADRVFGEEEKADAWLHRPNASLAGQRPVELLSDELGAAVVREMLERIDHGIFA
jgi:putative toxin-antitoxin system antitoxin component (TIGR02293 family)